MMLVTFVLAVTMSRQSSSFEWRNFTARWLGGWEARRLREIPRAQEPWSLGAEPTSELSSGSLLVVENVEPNAQEVSIQVLARIPRLTAKQADSLDALVDAIPRDVEGYTHRDMLTVTNGEPIRCQAGPDYVRISFDVPPENWKVGLSLMEALVRSSRLKLAETPSNATTNSWTAALRPYAHNRKPRPNEVADLYSKLFRPDNLTLGVGGALTPGAAQEEWERRMSAWTPPRLPPANPYEADPAPLTRNPGLLSTIEIQGPTFGARDAALTTRVLALMALGSGKGASLFRIARQTMGLSYRQEALLYPVPDGWQSRLLLETTRKENLERDAEALRTALLEDVRAWSDADLNRAKGMAEGVFLNGVNFSPFAFTPTGAVEDTLEGRTFLRTYWQLKTGEPWNAERFVSTMRLVTLDDLKEAATSVLTGAKVRVLPAG